MGLFDGAGDGSPSSTADVAAMIGAPVVVVVDASSMSHSVAALVHGFATFDPRVTIAGLILNRVGSPGHDAMLRAALEPLGIPIVGVLGRDDQLRWRDRHLGLVPVAEAGAAVSASLDRLASVVAAGCDLGAIERLAATAAVDGRGRSASARAGRPRSASPWPAGRPSASPIPTTSRHSWRRGPSWCRSIRAPTPRCPRAATA